MTKRYHALARRFRGTNHPIERRGSTALARPASDRRFALTARQLSAHGPAATALQRIATVRARFR
jgi:hypothetical protein